MTVVGESPKVFEHAGRPSRWPSVPLAVHAGLLAVVLVATSWFVGPRASFLPDEGAVILQARMLSGGHGWFERPALLNSIDPSGTWYPLDVFDRSGNGYAPFAKHPVYAVLAAGAYRVAGVPGIIGLSMLGTLVAALLSAALARRFDEALAVPTLWVVGLVSPLFFDAFMAVATTIAAALGVVAVLAAAHLVGPDRIAPIRVARAVSALAVSVGLAVLLRSEAVILAIALAGVLALTAAIHRRIPLAVAAAAALGGGAVARIAETKLRGRVLGAGTPAVPLGVQGGTAPGRSFLGARLSGFNHTWLEATHIPVPLANLVLTVVWLLVGALAVVLRREKVDRRVVVILSGGLILAAAARLLISPLTPVPGLLLAFPLLWAGMLLLARRDWTPLGMLTLGAAALFSVGVIATQYSEGGSLEWGGRYFALGIPIAVPPLMATFRRRGIGWAPDIRRVAAFAMIGVSVAMTVLAGLSLRSQHSEMRRMADAIVALSPPAADGPVVVTDVAWVARLVWTAYDGRSWLYVPIGQLGTAAERLQSAHRDQVTAVIVGPDCRAGAFQGYHIVDHRSVWAHGRLWQIATLRLGVEASGTSDRATDGC